MYSVPVSTIIVSTTAVTTTTAVTAPTTGDVSGGQTTNSGADGQQRAIIVFSVITTLVVVGIAIFLTIVVWRWRKGIRDIKRRARYVVTRALLLGLYIGETSKKKNKDVTKVKHKTVTSLCHIIYLYYLIFLLNTSGE